MSESGSNLTALYAVLGTLLLIIVVSLLVKYLLRHLKVKRNRESLHGQVVVITGSSSGLGEALAHSFFKVGARVVLCARRESELERVKNDLMSLNLSSTFPPEIVPLDLSDLNSVKEAVVKILDKCEHIDILINNGGVGIRSDVASTAIEVDMKVMAVNYFGSVAMTKSVLPSMFKQQSGRVVFVSSVSGKFAVPYRSAYCASKHAMQAFSDSLRAEVASKGIKVTCISPGFINTAISLNALTASGETYGKLDKATAGGTSSEEMANDIFNCILRDEKDVIICEMLGRIAYFIRFNCPSLFFKIMEKRALKLKDGDKTVEN